ANIRILCVSFFSAWRSRCSSAAGRRGRCICATIRRRASSRQSPRRPSRYPIRAATTLSKTRHDVAFAYRNGTLCAEQVSLEDIARRFGTPCYVYSRAAIESAYEEFAQALHGRDAMLCYSVKANSNLAVLALLARLGAGFDIVSGGELARVLAAGGDPRKILFSGVGKTTDEIRLALEKNIYCINLESAAELERVAAVARELGRRAPVAFRVNPDVDARTHPYISTGLRENKFGVAHRDAVISDPGRSMVGNAGVLLTRVEYAKPGEPRNFLVVDAAMNDLVRPALYDAWHEVRTVREPESGAPGTVYDIVGPICETADFLAKDRRLTA